MLWSCRSWEEQRPLERFFLTLANAGAIKEREWVWESKFGSCTCPVCLGRGHLYWTDEGDDFRFGCKERCDRDEILQALGLEPIDVMAVVPKWLRRLEVR